SRPQWWTFLYPDDIKSVTIVMHHMDVYCAFCSSLFEGNEVVTPKPPKSLNFKYILFSYGVTRSLHQYHSNRSTLNIYSLFEGNEVITPKPLKALNFKYI